MILSLRNQSRYPYRLGHASLPSRIQRSFFFSPPAPGPPPFCSDWSSCIAMNTYAISTTLAITAARAPAYVELPRSSVLVFPAGARPATGAFRRGRRGGMPGEGEGYVAFEKTCAPPERAGRVPERGRDSPLNKVLTDRK